MPRRPQTRRPESLPEAAPRQVEVKISGMSLDGEGLARTDDGAEVRVPFTLPGERVRVELERRGAARLVRVLAPSPHRVEAPCPFFGPCGGCTWQHVAYPEQLRLKHG